MLPFGDASECLGPNAPLERVGARHEEGFRRRGAEGLMGRPQTGGVAGDGGKEPLRGDSLCQAFQGLVEQGAFWNTFASSRFRQGLDLSEHVRRERDPGSFSGTPTARSSAMRLRNTGVKSI